MPLEIIRNDITKMKTDAIVNAANKSLLGGGGVDGAIHKAAGPKLLEECKMLKGCETGEAKITKGYDLDAKYVIHTVGPVWHGGNSGEENLLRNCYKNSLELAKEYGLKSISFPLISSGIYGYPKADAMKVAISVISDFLLDNEMTVYIVVFDNKAVTISEKLFTEIKQYIDDKYVEDRPEYRNMCCSIRDYEEEDLQEVSSFLEADFVKKSASAEDFDIYTEETFSTSLLKMIDDRGLKDSDTYKKANVSKQVFSKIRSDEFYQPSKATALSFCIALELDLRESEKLLRKAGYALSHSNKFDLIIEYFIKENEYDIFKINEALFSFQEKTLGV